MKPRRTHIKSTTGCKTCKRRRVRCDELKPRCGACTRLKFACDYDDTPSAPTSPMLGQGSEAQQLHLTSPQHGTDAFRTDYFQPQEAQEEFLFSFCIDVVRKLEDSDTLSIFWETVLLHESLKLAERSGVIRSCICEFASMHMASLTQAAEWVHAGQRYRQSALSGLREVMQDPPQHDLDIILAASVLLSWQASDSNEFRLTMNGVNTVLMTMDVCSHSSPLRNAFENGNVNLIPSSQMHQLIPSKSDLDLDLACSALQDLKKVMSTDNELLRGVKELQNYTVNLRISPPGPTITHQFIALYPIRFWLYWTPNILDRVSKQDPLAILFAAHYGMVVLAAAPSLPNVQSAFAVAKRAQFVRTICENFSRITAGSSAKNERNIVSPEIRDKLESLTHLPLAFATAFRLIY